MELFIAYGKNMKNGGFSSKPWPSPSAEVPCFPVPSWGCWVHFSLSHLLHWQHQLAAWVFPWDRSKPFKPYKSFIHIHNCSHMTGGINLHVYLHFYHAGLFFPWFFTSPFGRSEDFFALFQFQFRNHQGGAPRTLGPRGFFASIFRRFVAMKSGWKNAPRSPLLFPGDGRSSKSNGSWWELMGILDITL